jgi:hypothetical protein
MDNRGMLGQTISEQEELCLTQETYPFSHIPNFKKISVFEEENRPVQEHFTSGGASTLRVNSLPLMMVGQVKTSCICAIQYTSQEKSKEGKIGT